MIELVIAIVVMGIVVASLPTIMLQTQSNLNYAMQQEVITATKAKIGYTLAYDWDVNSYDEPSGYIRALATNSAAAAHAADPAFNNVGTAGSPRRVGHVAGERRQRLSTDTPTDDTNFNIKTAPNSNFNNGYPDIDDFHGDSVPVTITATDYDRVFTINQATQVVYVDDSTSGGTNYNNPTISFTFNRADAGGITNIKMVQVSSTGTDINITLSAFASNIGESRPLERAW
jgi:hypothetical protein